MEFNQNMFGEINFNQFIDELNKDNSQVIRSAFSFLCGDFLGNGCYRYVFEFMPDPKYVIKICFSGNPRHNILENEIWQAYSNTKLKRWLAPIELISKDGLFLLQRKTKVINKLPSRIPTIFTDIKPDNFGTIKGKIVCHDYGSSIGRITGLVNLKKMRKLSKDQRGIY